MELPKFLIWYIQGEDFGKLQTKKVFIECSTQEYYEETIEKLSKMKTVTNLKFIQIY